MDEAAPIQALVKALAHEAVLTSEGAVAAGEPVEPSPEAIGPVLDRWPVRANGAAGVN